MKEFVVLNLGDTSKFCMLMKKVQEGERKVDDIGEKAS